MVGYTEAALAGVLFDRLMHPDDVLESRAHLERLMAGEHETRLIEKRYIHRQGHVVWGLINTTVVSGADGRPEYFITVIQDVTERKRAETTLRDREEELRQAQKMEAIGRLAGGVAHDFNNLLTVIGGRAELLLSLVADDRQRSKQVEVILASARRAATLTRQLLVFSRKEVRQPELIDLHRVVKSLAMILQRLIGEDIAFFVRAGRREGRCTRIGDRSSR
jgi:PAS domain S-box-containing protein